MRLVGAAIPDSRQCSMKRPDAPSAPSKILIADDNQQNCELIEAYLADENYEITTVYDGQETLESVAASAPDIVLLDIMMPKLSGYEVCQRLKGAEATRSIP